MIAVADGLKQLVKLKPAPAGSMRHRPDEASATHRRVPSKINPPGAVEVKFATEVPGAAAHWPARANAARAASRAVLFSPNFRMPAIADNFNIVSNPLRYVTPVTRFPEFLK